MKKSKLFEILTVTFCILVRSSTSFENVVPLRGSFVDLSDVPKKTFGDIFNGPGKVFFEAEEPDEGTIRGPTKKPRSIQFRVDADGKLNSLAFFATSLMNRMSLPLSLLTPSS